MTSISGTGHGADHFSTSAQQVVDYLNAHSPLREWSVSRVAGGRQVHLHVHRDQFPLLVPGLAAGWNDDESLCHRMVGGADPIVADLTAHPSYRDHAMAGPVRAYAGVPISNEDGSLFGVLCGFSGSPLPTTEAVDGDLLRLLSDLLTGQLTLARQLDSGRRQLAMSEALNRVDPMTGLLNRQGWDAAAAEAQERLDAYGDPVSVAVLDLDALKQVNDRHGHQAGDVLLTRVADLLRGAERIGDRVARYGGDEFAILAHNVPADETESYFQRFRTALDQAGCPASLGIASALPGAVSVEEAFALADARMYDDKRTRKTRLVVATG
ncbi:MAG: hypothetical protein JWO46_896 [Nocardioidaceae bacterium]|nr:hypothetical protein [Nocardioidaceae bacterium]